MPSWIDAESESAGRLVQEEKGEAGGYLPRWPQHCTSRRRGGRVAAYSRSNFLKRGQQAYRGFISIQPAGSPEILSKVCIAAKRYATAALLLQKVAYQSSIEGGW
jgi:hypothetical protein